MASRDKKKKLSKSERKKSYQDKGKKGAEARGLGAGSRIDFSLPAQWTTEIASYDHHDAVKYISPGKTKYHSTKTVKETLAKRKMDFCLDYSSESSASFQLFLQAFSRPFEGDFRDLRVFSQI